MSIPFLELNLEREDTASVRLCNTQGCEVRVWPLILMVSPKTRKLIILCSGGHHMCLDLSGTKMRAAPCVQSQTGGIIDALRYHIFLFNPAHDHALSKGLM